MPSKQDAVEERGRALPEHLSGVAVPLGLLARRCGSGPWQHSPNMGGWSCPLGPGARRRPPPRPRPLSINRGSAARPRLLPNPYPVTICATPSGVL